MDTTETPTPVVKKVKKDKWSENKHWKKPKTASKKTTKTETKLLEEGDHLIGPASDLLGDPEHLLQDDSSPSQK